MTLVTDADRIERVFNETINTSKKQSNDQTLENPVLEIKKHLGIVRSKTFNPFVYAMVEEDDRFLILEFKDPISDVQLNIISREIEQLVCNLRNFYDIYSPKVASDEFKDDFGYSGFVLADDYCEFVDDFLDRIGVTIIPIYQDELDWFNYKGDEAEEYWSYGYDSEPHSNFTVLYSHAFSMNEMNTCPVNIMRNTHILQFYPIVNDDCIFRYKTIEEPQLHQMSIDLDDFFDSDEDDDEDWDDVEGEEQDGDDEAPYDSYAYNHLLENYNRHMTEFRRKYSRGLEEGYFPNAGDYTINSQGIWII